MTATQPGPAGRPDPLAFLDDEVAALRERHLYRKLRVMSSAQGPIVSIDDRRLISLSSNDYLGLTNHPRICDAAAAAVREFGAGSGAVRTIAGTMTLHDLAAICAGHELHHIAQLRRIDRSYCS